MLGTLALIAKVVSKVLPGKSKKASEEIAESIARTDSEIQQRVVSDMDRMLEYEGKASIMPKFIQVVRGLVRPIVTCAVITVFLRAVILKDMPIERLWIVTLSVITFWFCGRLAEKLLKKSI